MANDGTDRTGAEWASKPAGRIMPNDVQQKEFRVARFGGGYRMREVDEFLDRITDTLTSLMAENDRLRGDRPATSPVSSIPLGATDEPQRAAIEAFLQREKAFLQSLGALVQEHAEELKGMVRATRRAPQVVAPAVAGSDEGASASAEQEAPEPVAAEEPTPPPAAAEEEPEEPQGSGADVAATGTAAGGGVESAPAEGEAEDGSEEPIRLEEPAPARSRRPDEGSEGSLRELFWGEE